MFFPWYHISLNQGIALITETQWVLATMNKALAWMSLSNAIKWMNVPFQWHKSKFIFLMKVAIFLFKIYKGKKVGYSHEKKLKVLLYQSTHLIYSRDAIKCIFKIWSERPFPVLWPHLSFPMIGLDVKKL